MKRFNLELTDETHQKLLELQQEMGAASVSETIRRAVLDAHRRVFVARRVVGSRKERI